MVRRGFFEIPRTDGSLMLLCFKHPKPASSLDSECFFKCPENRRFFEKTKSHTTLEMTRSRHHCPILPFKNRPQKTCWLGTYMVPLCMKKSFMYADLARVWCLYVWRKVSWCWLGMCMVPLCMREGFMYADLARAWFLYVWRKVSCMLTWHMYGSFFMSEVWKC
jgi:hypothetical protein